MSDRSLIHHFLLLLTLFLALLVVDHALCLEVILERFNFELLVAQISLHFHFEEAHWQLVHVFMRGEVTFLGIVHGCI